MRPTETLPNAIFRYNTVKYLEETWYFTNFVSSKTFKVWVNRKVRRLLGL